MHYMQVNCAASYRWNYSTLKTHEKQHQYLKVYYTLQASAELLVSVEI